MLATTKQVRNIVRSIAGASLYGNSYTDITKANNNLRNVTFFIDAHKAETVKERVALALFAAGFKNVVKVTTSKQHEFLRCGGNTYLRINNCVLA